MDDPELRAQLARERGQLELPFSESARPDVKETVKETQEAILEALKKSREK